MQRTFVLLDRDGTIIVDKHYLADPAGVELLPGAVEGLRRLTDLGCGLVVVTNQSGVARGYFDEATLGRIHDRMREILRDDGIEFAGVYYCPHDDEAACRCRKPGPGMVERAAAELGFDPRTAYVLGDKRADVELGRAVGAKSILVRTGYGTETERQAQCTADFTANDLRDAAEWILKNRRD